MKNKSSIAGLRWPLVLMWCAFLIPVSESIYGFRETRDTPGITTWEIRNDPKCCRVFGRISQVKSVFGQVPNDIDLSDENTVRQIYYEGCQFGDANNLNFNTIYLYQNQQVAVEGNLRGCTIKRNYAAEKRKVAEREAAYRRAREVDQEIENIEGIEESLKRELNGEVGMIKYNPSCKEGCKEFAILRNEERNISPADRANGITEARRVEIRWIRRCDEQKWCDAAARYTYSKVNGQWTNSTSIMEH